MMPDQPDLENPRIVDLLLAICFPICAVGLGFVSLFAVVYLGLVGFMFPAAGLAFCLWIFVRPKSRTIGIGVAVAGLEIMAWSLLLLIYR
jgi:hypothetical protein